MQEPSAGPNLRQVGLIAAAEAARAWARQRRAVWTEGGDALPPFVPLVAAAFAAGREPGVADPVRDVPPRAAKLANRLRGLREHVARSSRSGLAVGLRAARASRDLVVQGRKLAAVTTVLVAVVLAAAWTVRTGWRYAHTVFTTGTLVMDSTPEGADVSIDGISIGKTPMTREFPAGRHLIEFSDHGAKRLVPLDIAARHRSTANVDWNARPAGHLQVQSDPPGARVIVDGRERGVTPLTVDGLTVGAHGVVLDSPRGSVGRTVTIVADDTAHISEAIYSGWLHVSSPIELTITEGAGVDTLDERNQVMLASGPHVLRLENRDFGYRDTREIEIKPGELTRLVVNPAPSALSVTATSPAQVVIDGAPAGETPLANYPVNLGTRDVLVKAASGGERRFTLTVTVAPVRIDVDFSRPPAR